MSSELEAVTEDVAQWLQRAPKLAQLRNYDEGRHSLNYLTDAFRAKYGHVVNGLRENLCPAVRTGFTDGLEIVGWGDKTADDDADDDGLGNLTGLMFDEAFRAGDAYALVWPGRQQQPTASLQRADMIVPTVDPLDPTQLLRGSRIWTEPGRALGRVNVYDAEKVTRWQTTLPSKNATIADDATWTPYRDTDPDVIPHELGANPLVWIKQDAADQVGYGRSILDDVIPLQDMLNHAWAVLAVTAISYGLPFWYLLAYKPNEDPLAGATAIAAAIRKQATFDPTKQRIFTTDSPGPFGQLEPPDLERILNVIAGTASAISRVVGIPSFYFTQTSGDVPSGESLRVLSMRRTARIRRFQRSATPALKGLAELLGFEDPRPRWADPMPMDEQERVELAVAKHRDLGYALTDAIGGLNESDPDGIVARATQAKATSAAAAGQAFRDGAINYGTPVE